MGIKLERVSVVYKNGVVGLDNVNFTVKDGGFVFITGASGSGKSTMFRVISGEAKEELRGRVIVNNYDFAKCNRRLYAEARRTVGMVFQDFRLIRSMTVEENLEFAMRCVGANRASIERRIPEVLDIVGLLDKADALPNELSGGEQQRIAIARAIINRPTTVLADEPTGNLDPVLAREIMDIFIQINARLGTTTIIITHARELVERYKKRVVTISDGRIVSDTVGGMYLDREAVQQL